MDPTHASDREFEGVSLSQQIIPEFFWMALLNEQFGWQRGAELSLGLARSAAITTGVDPTAARLWRCLTTPTSDPRCL
jgi:hypothetical protein